MRNGIRDIFVVIFYPKSPSPERVRIISMLAAGLGLILCLKSLLIPIRVQGNSMNPTYRDGRINFVNRLSYYINAPKRGHIVAIRGSTNRHLSFVYLKRIVALPGEQVFITNGWVFVNGARQSEPYVGNRWPWQIPLICLSRDEYMVIGDNREMDESRHRFGWVNRSNILGRPLW
jgi:signal peptidase I